MTDKLLIERELLPCPFCGDKPELPSGEGTQYEIGCSGCGQAMASVQICDLMSLEERAAASFTNYLYADEFVERAKKQAIENWNTRAAPRQPEGDAISRERVQSEADAFFDWPTADKSSVTTTSCLIFARCIAGMVAAERDATIAELREECEHLKACQENDMLHMTGLVAECERLRVFNKSLDEEASKRLQDVTEAEDEAYALRQQLAERDAELRHARQSIQHMIDQTTPLVPDPDNPGWAKRIQLDDVISQRDKLAGLLREIIAEDSVIEVHGSDVCDRIGAALAEVNK